MGVPCLHTLAELRAFREELGRRASQRVALVPTMGALHAGHLSLVKRARELADHVIVSIFVNPTQFGPNEDFTRYPRTLEADLALLTAHGGVAAVFCPDAAEVFPAGFQTYVDNHELALGLCGAERPGHFRGVCTVVLKLFLMTQPHLAVFGKKDYQQWKVLERMATDLNLPLAVVGAPLLRDHDGLALSSRNRYLEPAARELALNLPRALQTAAELYRRGERQTAELLAAARGQLSRPGIELGYLSLRTQDRFTEISATQVEEPAVMLAAIRVAGVRLIDNIELGTNP